MAEAMLAVFVLIAAATFIAAGALVYIASRK
jgi:hypothetical protein